MERMDVVYESEEQARYGWLMGEVYCQKDVKESEWQRVWGDVVERVRSHVPVKERTFLRCICVLLDE